MAVFSLDQSRPNTSDSATPESAMCSLLIIVLPNRYPLVSLHLYSGMPSLYVVDPSLSPVDHRYPDDATVSFLLMQRVACRMQMLVFVQSLSTQQHPLQHLRSA